MAHDLDIMSKDGLTNWMSTGLAYQGTQTPVNANSKWLRYTDGTVNQWHNMERASVYQENGHVTHFTFAVTDVDKNTTAVNSGGPAEGEARTRLERDLRRRPPPAALAPGRAPRARQKPTARSASGSTVMTR